MKMIERVVSGEKRGRGRGRERGGRGVLVGLMLLLAPMAKATVVCLTNATGATYVPATALLNVSNATATATTSATFDIPAGKALNFEMSITCTNTGTSNIVAGLDTTSDGFTFTTTQPLTMTVAANGSNTVVGRSVLMATNFPGVKGLRWDTTTTTQTNNARVNYLKVSWDQ